MHEFRIGMHGFGAAVYEVLSVRSGHLLGVSGDSGGSSLQGPGGLQGL